MFKKIIALLLIPIFLASNLTFADTLVPYYLTKVRDEKVTDEVVRQVAHEMVSDITRQTDVPLEDVRKVVIDRINYDWVSTDERKQAFISAVTVEFAKLGVGEHLGQEGLAAFRTEIRNFTITAQPVDPLAVVSTLDPSLPVYHATTVVTGWLEEDQTSDEIFRRLPQLEEQFDLTSDESVALALLVSPGQGSGTVQVSGDVEVVTGGNIPAAARKLPGLDITNATHHLRDGIPMVPSAKGEHQEEFHKGGLTEEDLAREYAELSAVRDDLIESLEKGFLNWPKRILKKNVSRAIDEVSGKLQECRDVVVLGAPALAKEILNLEGTPIGGAIKINGKRFHFVETLEGHRYKVMEEELEVDWTKTAIVYISQGVGDVIQGENYTDIETRRDIEGEHKVAIIPKGYNDHSIKERTILHEGGSVLITPDFLECEGMPFSAEGFALTLALAGLDYKTICMGIGDHFEDVSARPLSKLRAGRFSAVQRGLSHDNNRVRKTMILPSEVFSVTGMPTYGRRTNGIVDGLADTWNATLGGRTHLDVYKEPDGQHHMHQMGASAHTTSVAIVAPDEFREVPHGMIPTYALAAVRSKPGKPFSVSEFNTCHLAAFTGDVQNGATSYHSGWGNEGGDNPIPAVTLRYRTKFRGKVNPLADIISLVGVLHPATLMSHKVANREVDGKKADTREGNRVTQEPERLKEILERMDRAIHDREFQRNAEFEDSPFVIPVTDDERNRFDLRGLAKCLGIDNPEQLDKEGQQILAACLSLQVLAQQNHFETKKSAHSFWQAPQEAADPNKKERFDRARETARDIGHGGKDFYILAVGGAHNSSINGSLPLREFYANETTGKTPIEIDTTDEIEIDKMCQRIKEGDNARGTRVLYVSNSGDTVESDIAYCKLLEALHDKIKDDPTCLEGVTPPNQLDFINAEKLSKIMGKEVTAKEHMFLRSRIIVATGEGKSMLYDGMSAIGFTTVPYPETNGRQSIFPLGLIAQAFLGIDEKTSEAYIDGANKYIKSTFILSEDNSTRKDELANLDALIDALSEGTATPKQAGVALSLLRQDPGMLAGSLVGLLNRPDIPEETGVEIEGMRPKTKLRIVYLSDGLHGNEWIERNNFNESLGKPQIQFIALDITSPNLLQQLAVLGEERDSTFLLITDERTTATLNDHQKALVGFTQHYLAEAGIPCATLFSSSAPDVHSASTFALQNMAIGIGGQQVTAEGYPQDGNHLGEIKVTEDRETVKNTIDNKRGIKKVGMHDIVETWNLDPDANENDKAFLDFIKVTGETSLALFPLIRGWDPAFIGDSEKAAQKMVDTVVEHIRADENLKGICRAALIVNPMTNEVIQLGEEEGFSKDGENVALFVADDPTAANVLANTTNCVFSLFKLDKEVIDGKTPIDQQLFNKNNLVVQTVSKFGAFPMTQVIAPRYEHLAAHNYLPQIVDGKIEYIPKVAGATSRVAMPKKKGSSLTILGPVNKFPTVLRDHIESEGGLIDQGGKSRQMGEPLSNAVFLTRKGGVTGAVQPLLTAFLGHRLMWSEACRGGDPMYFDEDGCHDTPSDVRFGNIVNKSALRPVLAIAADKPQTASLREAINLASPNAVKASEDLLQPKEHEKAESLEIDMGTTLEEVLEEALNRNAFVDEGLKSDVTTMVSGLMEIAVAKLPAKYLDPSSGKSSGTNPSAESQFFIDALASKMTEEFARDSGCVGGYITEEDDIKRFEKGRLIFLTDPVDGVGNLAEGHPTAQFYSLVDSHTGRAVAAMMYAQGTGRLTLGVGDATYAFQYVLDGYETGDPIPFADEEEMSRGKFYLLGRFYDNTDSSLPGKLGEGGTVNQYFSNIRAIRDRLIQQEGYSPDNNGCVAIDAKNILTGAHRGTGRKAYMYPSLRRAKGGKLRIVENYPMAVSMIGVTEEELSDWMETEEGGGGIDNLAKEMFASLLKGDPDELVNYPAAHQQMRQLAIDRLNINSGLKVAFGMHKNPLWSVTNLDDKTLPGIPDPVCIGEARIVDEYSEALWEDYVNDGEASAMQRDREWYEWNAEEDPEWETYGPYDRRARLRDNEEIGAVKLANGTWVSLIGKDNVRPEIGAAYVDQFAERQEEVHNTLMAPAKTGADEADSIVAELFDNNSPEKLPAALVDASNALLENPADSPLARQFFTACLERAKTFPSGHTEEAQQLHVIAGQGLNILSWRSRNIPGADKIRLTAEPDEMLQSPDKEGRGSSFLEAASMPTVQAEGEGKPGSYWRGFERIGKMGKVDVSDEQAFNAVKDNLALYVMVHGWMAVPEGLSDLTDNKEVSTIHETTFVTDRIQGSDRCPSTGPGHFQDTSLDIKYVTEGQFIQHNKYYDAEGNLIVDFVQYVEAGKWAVALPGAVDSMEKTDKDVSRFNDASVKVDRDDIEKLLASISKDVHFGDTEQTDVPCFAAYDADGNPTLVNKVASDKIQWVNQIPLGDQPLTEQYAALNQAGVEKWMQTVLAAVELEDWLRTEEPPIAVSQDADDTESHEPGNIGKYDVAERPKFDGASFTEGLFTSRLDSDVTVDLRDAVNVEELSANDVRRGLKDLENKIDNDEARGIVSNLGTSILGRLESGSARIVIFDHPEENIISFGQDDLIGISRSIFSPMAVLHEAGHACHAEIIDRMESYLRANDSALLQRMLKKAGEDASREVREHYILRAFQSSVLPTEDQAFKQAIKREEGNYDAVLADKRAGERELYAQVALLPEDVEAGKDKVSVVMVRGLAEKAKSDSDSAIDMHLKAPYQRIKRLLKKQVGEIIEVESAEELGDTVSRLLADGRKVIVMDDGLLTQNLNKNNLLIDSAGNEIPLRNDDGNLNYCVVSAVQRTGLTGNTVPVVDLEAMYYMGIGILNNRPSLFNTAYRAFTGREASPDMREDVLNGTLWIIRGLPRIARLDFDTIDMIQKMKELLGSAV